MSKTGTPESMFAMKVPIYLLLVVLCCASSVSGLNAEEPVSFNHSIRPILAEHCFQCHGTDAESRKAGLRLDVRESALEVGAIEPGDADNSELVSRVFSDDNDVIMPPVDFGKPLDEGQKLLLKRWISDGAKYQKHWAFELPVRSATAEAASGDGWSHNPIDRFVLQRMREQGLEPAPELEPERLFRRLHLDITGLPPEPELVKQFVADHRRNPEQAISYWIDRLMDEPAWGEHRARYWLDAARYADTHGMHFDNYREIWPYRDWVIRAFNANEPFDQFIVEQLAGDLLPDPTLDQLVATGFQRCNMTTNEGGTIAEENLALYAADRVQTLGWVFLGLTTNCCQCHDHKFDPLTMKDYYSLAAFFRNTEQGPMDGNVADGNGPVVNVPLESDLPRWIELKDEIRNANENLARHGEQVRSKILDWVGELSPEFLEKHLPADGLVLRIPLDRQTDSAIQTVSSEPVAVNFTGKREWDPDGKFGPAPILRKEQTIVLDSDIGAFKKDQPFSFGAWIKAGRSDNFGSIMARMDPGNGFRGWDLWQEGDRLAVHVIDSWPNNSFKVVTNGSRLTPGKWQHVFATYDGSSKPEGIHIFVDGVSIPLSTANNTIKPDANIVADTPLRIGQRNVGDFFEDASVQDVRVYNRLLTEKEVFALALHFDISKIVQQEPGSRSEDQNEKLAGYYLALVDTEYPDLKKQVADLETEREMIRSRSPITHVQRERRNHQPMADILMRGDYSRPGEEVVAATPSFLHPFPEDAPANRLGLAKWIVSPDNALTARVTVNRFWQQVFGRGIVETSEDFGTMGSLPTHPELLDWLAIEFQESGWDVKQLFKLMLTSATYRQACQTTPVKLEVDPGNLYYSRGPRFRMDAEMIRDYALTVSGLLSTGMYGPGTRPYQPDDIWNVVGLPQGNTRNYVQDHGANLYRRSIYHFWKRMAPPPDLETLNAPSREVCTVRRERTNTPLQALVTLNDTQFVEAARVLAQHLLENGEATESPAIADRMAWQVLGRPFTEFERNVVEKSHDELHQFYSENPDQAGLLVDVGEAARDRELDPVELATWTLICNQVLNLDETLNK